MVVTLRSSPPRSLALFLIAAFLRIFAGDPGGTGLLLTVAILAGAVMAVVRGARTSAKTLRGRLCAIGWNLALLLLALTIASTIVPGRFVTVLTAVAIITFGRPRHVKLAVGAGLVLLGLYGFIAVRAAGFGSGWGQPYGLTAIGAGNLTFYLPLPQAYAYLLAGGWICWRASDRTSVMFRWLLRRTAEPGAAGRPWGLLLVPVVIMAAALFVPNLWFGQGAAGLVWPVLILAAAVYVVRVRPRAAGNWAVAGLIGLGFAGLYLQLTYDSFSHLPVNAAGYTEYGLIEVTGQTMADLCALQALAFIGAGIWLVPRAAPDLLSYAGVAGYRDLAQRVQRLTESRAVVVDSAAADLRRLERDLHDGAQARLVALGMHLRAVEKLIPVNPGAAIALVAEAREVSAQALAELRELVRGVHPPVLADRGLTDAIRALALDCPLHVDTEIDLDGRAPAPIETACYFAVAELLTNAAKHSGARDARVTIGHQDRMLRLSVTDFGLGGADPQAGSGLAGIERRLAAFDGILAVSSPPGGPTTIVIEVPCALAPVPLRSRS
jgi:signal transduction histidine kinase